MASAAKSWATDYFAEKAGTHSFTRLIFAPKNVFLASTLIVETNEPADHRARALLVVRLNPIELLGAITCIAASCYQIYGEFRMEAYIWNANPAKWNVVPPATNSWDALKAHINDQSGYVYWSTPVLHSKIKIGDGAFIWRTKYRDHENGIVAIGRVEEVPRQLSPSTQGLFALQQRLLAAGWNEAQAPFLEDWHPYNAAVLECAITTEHQHLSGNCPSAW